MTGGFTSGLGTGLFLRSRSVMPLHRILPGRIWCWRSTALADRSLPAARCTASCAAAPSPPGQRSRAWRPVRPAICAWDATAWPSPRWPR
nr:MAG TPA: hypothetical protein [Caudoviricetes sp.]